MKTKKIIKSGSRDEERLIIDPPYTVFEHSILPKSYCLTMEVKGLKEMLKDLDDEDAFRIEVFNDRDTEYSFLKK